MHLYLTFCEHYGTRDINPSVDTICMYIAFLADRFNSAKSVLNYISGVRLFHKLINVNANALSSFDVFLMLRATKLTMRRIPRQKLPITPALLSKLCHITEGLGIFGLVLKVAMTFAFYGMLRQSNLAPRTAGAFDVTRHTTRRDVQLTPPGVCIALKWSKTMQTVGHGDNIPLPTITGHVTDPVAAYSRMIAALPTRHPTEPLLTLPGKGARKTVTTALLSKGLAILLECIDIDPHLYSLHSFRRGGATAAFNAGVNVLDLKRHGTWRSDAFTAYVTPPCPENSRVAAALASSALAH